MALPSRIQLPLWIAALTLCPAHARSAEPVLSLEDQRFWRDQAERMVAAARLAPGQKTGEFKNDTPYTVRVPGGNMGYPAFWVRDAVMMLGSDLVPADEIEGWIRLMASTLRGPHDWQVRPGVVVPAFAVPDHINFDGRPTFYPGNYETGDKQGGHPWGKYPPLDDHFYFLQVVYDHWKMTKDLRLFKSSVKTSFNEMKLCDLCERIYRVAPTDAATGLCIAGDVEKENAKDWGFCDAESKSGKLLFPSVLRFIAAKQLGELFSAAGEKRKAEQYEADARLVRTSIVKTFFHAGTSASEGILHSATGVCNQADVWGSAYAVFSGAVDDDTATRIGKALVRGYRERTAVREGCVRQLLTTDPLKGGGWEVSVSGVGTYQNGGYWGTPTGWYIASIDKVDHQAARDMAADFVLFLKTHRRPDGTAEAYEWSNPDTKQSSNPLYVATVALPYVSLQQAGLLRGSK